MKMAALFLPLLIAATTAGAEIRSVRNPQIDIDAHLKLTREAAEHRASRRVTEAEFLAISRQPGTIVLDARSKARYDELHVEGAVNLSFPDITVDSLAQLIPDKKTTVLIYCNNNFANAEAFPAKLPPASLNLSTYATLYIYGYRNVFELGPYVEVGKSKLTFASAK